MVGLKTNKCCCDCYTFLDDFTRPNSTDVGPNWQECTGDWRIFNNSLVGYEKGIITLLQMVGNPYGILKADVSADEEAVYQIFVYRGTEQIPCDDVNLYFVEYEVGTGGSGFISLYRGDELVEQEEVFSPAGQVSFGVCVDVDGIAVEFEGKRLFQVCIDVEDESIVGYWFALGNGGPEEEENVPTVWESIFYSDHFDHNRRCPKCMPSCCFPNVNRTVAGFYITIDNISSNDCTCPPGYQTFLPINDLNAVCNCETVGGAITIEYPNTGAGACATMDLQWSFSCSEVTGLKTFGLTIQPQVGTEVSWGFVFPDGTLPEDVQFDDLLVNDAGDGLVCDFSAATLTLRPFVTEGCCGGIPEDEINVTDVISFCTGRSILTGNLTPVIDVQNIAGAVTGTSITTAFLTAFSHIEGLAKASSKLTGRAEGESSLEGSTKATSTLTGVLSAQGSTGGEVTAATFLDGNLTALAYFSKDSISTSSTTGDIGALAFFSKDSVSTSSTTGEVSSFQELAGGVSGTSTLTGALGSLSSVSGAAKASSNLTGRLDGDTSLQGASVAASVASGSLSALSFALGAVEASSALTGALRSLQSMVGGSTATTELEGNLTQIAQVAGGVLGSTILVGGLGAISSAQGSVRGSSKLTGRIDGETSIEGQAKGTSTLGGALSADAYFSKNSVSTSIAQGDLGALAYFSKDSVSTSLAEGTLESCCCGDCIQFRYVLSGVANNNCTNCAQFNTTIDSPNVNPDESCVYDAAWESDDCGGQKIVFKAQLVCDDDGDIRLSGQIQDTAIVGPLVDPPGGPTPTNDVMSGTDTFVTGTPCDYLEISLTRDTGAQTTCDFDSATVSLSVIPCPAVENLKAVARKKKLAKKKKASLPVVCKHLGDAMGIADCGCSGKPMVYHCNLLNKPCMKKSVSKPVSRVGDKRISRPQVCSLCDHFEA
jgi:hypothetical protein